MKVIKTETLFDPISITITVESAKEAEALQSASSSLSSDTIQEDLEEEDAIIVERLLCRIGEIVARNV